MTRFLLDTNAVSHLMREPRGVIARRIREVGQANIVTSILVFAEVRFGLERSGSRRLNRQFSAISEGLSAMAFESPADLLYGHVRADLTRRGQLIGALDMLIAAHALATECVLVTDNIREFSPVPNLQVENWLRPAG